MVLSKPARPRGPEGVDGQRRYQSWKSERDEPLVALFVKPVRMRASNKFGERLATPVRRLEPYATRDQDESPNSFEPHTVSNTNDSGKRSKVTEVSVAERLSDPDRFGDLVILLDDVDPIGMRGVSNAKAVVREGSYPRQHLCEYRGKSYSPHPASAADSANELSVTPLNQTPSASNPIQISERRPTQPRHSNKQHSQPNHDEFGRSH